MSQPPLDRRAALARLGLGAAVAYVAPLVVPLSEARASHGSGGSWRGSVSFPSHGSFPGGHWHRRRRLRWRHHPRHGNWVGRHFPHEHYVVIRDYHRYHLPPPGPGYFYARVDRDVFLIAEGTKRIIDAFVLFDAVGR